jgi:hypothetical protein
MGVNNTPRTFRPNLWTCVDPPEHFIRSIWLDPTIRKFVPAVYRNNRIFNSDTWQWMDRRVGECPCVEFFELAERFEAGAFLSSEKLMWGEPKEHGGGRSVMLPALRVLHDLGIRRVFLLGCDFRMSRRSAYHFDQARHRSAVHGNLHSYARLNPWGLEHDRIPRLTGRRALPGPGQRGDKKPCHLRDRVCRLSFHFG